MSLFSAIYASISGMKAQTNLLATVSENIANSNTTGYKQASTLFHDLITQLEDSIGYSAGGVRTSVRYNISQQGDLMRTASATDLAIHGNGFFVVQNANGDVFLTRAGSFTPDALGALVNGAGYTLMGYNLASGAGSASSGLSSLVPVTIDKTALAAAPSTAGTFTANLDSNASALTGSPSFTNYTSKTSIIAYTHLGDPVTLDIIFSKTGENTWQADIYDDESPSAPLTSQTLSFDDTNGKLLSPTPGTLSIPVPGGNTVSLNIANMTQLASSFAVSAASMDGNAPSQVQSVTVGSDGTLSYVYGNGNTIPAFKIPLGNVVSPNNLYNLSGGIFQVSEESGDLIVGNAGTGGLGSIQSFELETSTVDLASQLTEMIVAQRGYESNSKVFQTGSDMLGTLINMIRA
ncbi:MAG TPA: flagellar hook protein FlgE [Methylocella sp.]|nr:flagellar hook protein FlgE [Methylocella sp.]